MQMNDRAKTVLSLMVEQFTQRHGQPPKQIVLTPLALLGLAIKRSVAPSWCGIPVVCREIAEAEAAENGGALGVFVLPEDRSGRLVSCDLRYE